MNITDALVVGYGHTKFGKLSGTSSEHLVVDAARQAIARAGVEPKDIDAIYVGNFNSGMQPFSSPSSLPLQLSGDLRGVPATRVENACASGSAAVHQGVLTLLSGIARTVLVVGVEKMTDVTGAAVGAALLGADYDAAGTAAPAEFAGLFAKVAVEYEQRYGPVGDTLAEIAAKSHQNALRNPLAHLHKNYDRAFCATVSEANPIVAGPLRRTDCSPVSDGAAALVLSTQRSADASVPPVRFRGIAHANDFLPSAKRDPLDFYGSEQAWHRAMGMAEATLDELSFIELHDCFTIAELNLYEVLGLAPRGRGREVLHDGTVGRDGKLPVNPSGGLKSKRHPVGATGVRQHVLAAMQLTGAAGDMQVDGASLAAVHNMGGLAIANYVSILESV